MVHLLTQLQNNLNTIYNELMAKLTPENLKSGVTILSVTGTYSGLDTSDATATVDDICSGETAYVNGAKITGQLDNIDALMGFSVNTITETNDGVETTFYQSDEVSFYWKWDDNETLANNCKVVVLDKSDLAQAIGLTANKIKAGETILGITGTYSG